MSFTNLKYDTFNSKEDLRESNSYLQYNINNHQECNECFLNEPLSVIQRAGDSVDAEKPMIDIDSELMGITRKASNDPSKQFMPKLDKNGNPIDNSL